MTNAFRSTAYPAAYNNKSAQVAAEQVVWALIRTVRASYVTRDVAFLSLLVAMSLALYVYGLGFYSDDWQYLGRLSVAADTSFVGLLQAAWDFSFWMRPAQLVYTVALCSVFGIAPLGYHLINALLLAAMAVLFYLALHELRQPRLMSLSVPLIYLLLPQYSTDRFWFLADGANLSIGLYLLSLFADLRSVAHSARPSIRWRLVSAAALLLSTLTYEHALLLFLLNPFLTWYRVGAPRTLRQLTLSLAPNVALVALVGLFKVFTSTRLADSPFSFDRVAWFVEIVKSEAYYHLATEGLYLPVTAWKLFSRAPSLALAAVACATFLLSLVYLSRLSRELPSRRYLGGMMLAGVLVYVLACATFFLSRGDLQATATGAGNRTAIAFAGGVALLLVGASGLISTAVPIRRLRTSAFSVLLAVVCTAGVVVINSLATFWVAAADKQRVVLDDIRENFATLPSGTALLLDGVCQYVGPAMVFEGGTWDLTGALLTMYGDPTLRGDLVTPRLTVTDDGLLTEAYGFSQRHAYESVLLYNMRERANYRFADASSARAYFATHNPDFTNGCPTGLPGFGLEVV